VYWIVELSIHRPHRGNDDYSVLKATFNDLCKQIPKLSRPYSVFKDFPGPGKLDTFFLDLRPCGHPESRDATTPTSAQLPGHHSLRYRNRLTDAYGLATTDAIILCHNIVIYELLTDCLSVRDCEIWNISEVESVVLS